MHIWDYHLPSDWKPKTHAEWEWFLVRKINYNDLEEIKKDDLVKYFAKIKKGLDRGKQILIEYFLTNYRHGA